MFKISFLFICFLLFTCVISSEEYKKDFIPRSEFQRNRIINSQNIHNPVVWSYQNIPHSVPLSRKSFNFKVPFTIPIYNSPSERYKRRIYRGFNACSQLPYFGYNLDSSINGVCTLASECLESALSSQNIKRENQDLLKDFVKLTSGVLQPTCLYKDSDGITKFGICCKKYIAKPVENINEIINETLTYKITPESDHISTYVAEESRPLMDRGHIFSRPQENIIRNDNPSPVTSSQNRFKDDYWIYPVRNVHPTHPPFVTHPPEHTNKPWWTTKSPITIETPKPSREYDYWEIRRTDKPVWWQEQSTPPTTTIPPSKKDTTTRPPMWWHPEATRWWVQRYTTSSPKTPTWQRHITTTTTTTTTTPTTTTTTTPTARPALATGEEYCLPSFYKRAKNLPLEELKVGGKIFDLEEPQDGEHRITGGTHIIPNSYPWIAVLFQSDKHVCGGSLIDDVHVLTAAHCVATLTSWQLKRMVVYLGMHDLSRSEESRQAYTIKTVVRHKDYSRRLLYNDIAVLTLNEKVRFTSQVHPICLYGGSDAFYNDVATVAGWGSLYEGGNQLDTPRKVDLKIWSNNDCGATYGPAAPGGIISSHLCAGKINKDACSGDSGGPFMKKINGVWMQIGIVSWGIGCGKGDYPGVYSRISSFLPWIRKVQGAY